jgi:hypothetical protein
MLLYTQDGKERHDMTDDRHVGLMLWEIHWIVEFHRPTRRRRRRICLLPSFSLPCFVPVRMCVCVKGGGESEQREINIMAVEGFHRQGHRFLHFLFGYYTRGESNTHSYTDGWMAGPLLIVVPASSSTPATSKEDYTHIRSFWLISPIQSTQSGSLAVSTWSSFFPLLFSFYMSDYSTSFFFLYLFIYFVFFLFPSKKEGEKWNRRRATHNLNFSYIFPFKCNEPRWSTFTNLFVGFYHVQIPPADDQRNHRLQWWIQMSYKKTKKNNKTGRQKS